MQLTLKRDGCSAVIDTMGGELTSYRDAAGLEYIWQGSPDSWTGHNPLLFPIVGRLKDDKITALGRECHMPQHGVARKRSFTVTEQSMDHAVLEQRSDADTLDMYPFPYLLRVRHDVKCNGFTTAITVVNTGETDLPFCLGGHTAFRCPQRPGECFEDYELIFDKAESISALLPNEQGLMDHTKTMRYLEETNTLPLDYAVFDQVDTLCFDALRSHGVSLRHRENGHGVHMDFTSFPMVAFWTPPGKAAPFLCIEPWQGCADYEDGSGDFSDKPYAVQLKPGEHWSIGYTVTVL